MAKHRIKPYSDYKLGKGQRSINWIVAGALVAFVVIFLAARLYFLMISGNDYFSQLAGEQQLRDTTIEAQRGDIYDATGKTLASSSIAWDISCDPKSSKGLYTSTGEGDNIVRTLNESVCNEISTGIARILTANDGSDGENVDVSSEEFIENYNTVHDAFSQVNTMYRVLADKADLPVAEAVKNYISAYNKAKTTKDSKMSIVVTVTKTYKRNYPYGAFAAAVIGFCDDDGAGFYGLEKYYDEELSGVNGRSIGIRDANGNEIADEIADETTTVYAAQDGYNLTLTLDANVQQTVEKYLTEAIKANSVCNRGCAIVMNVNTGAIIALANEPDFDPNEPYEIYDVEYMANMITSESEIYGHYETEKDADGNVLKDEKGNTVYVTDDLGNKVLIPYSYEEYEGTMREMQWRNKAITELYYPGSVYKVLTSAAGLDSGSATLDTSFNCSGYFNVADRTYHCANKKAHGVQNMAMGLRNSCNIYYIQLAQQMGATTFCNYFSAFGLDEMTGVDLPYEARRTTYYSRANMGEVELASSAFGQSMKVTPLQMCAAVAACANGGYLVSPYVVSTITDSNGNVVKSTETTVKRQVISEATSEAMREILEYEVGDGTNTDGGYRAYVAGYRVGGKSGTSEQLDMTRRATDGDYKKVASFMAVFPADDPEYLVYIMLDDPNNASTDYSSVLAAPVVGNIISDIAPYLGVSTTGEDLSETTVKVPSLVNTEWGNAQVELNRKGLKHRLITGSGDATGATVTYQYPKAGTEVAGGTTVYLYTDAYSGTIVTVPDVTGKTSAFAQQMLSAAGLNCIVAEDSGGVITSQSIEPNTEAEMGTVVTITTAAAESSG